MNEIELNRNGSTSRRCASQKCSNLICRESFHFFAEHAGKIPSISPFNTWNCLFQKPLGSIFVRFSTLYSWHPIDLIKSSCSSSPKSGSEKCKSHFPIQHISSSAQLRDLRLENQCAVTTSGEKSFFEAGKIEFCHCAAVLQTQVPGLCTDLDLSLLYILTLGTYSKFARKNNFLALGVCFPQACSSAGRRFAASRSRLQTCRRILSFSQQKIRWNAL